MREKQFPLMNPAVNHQQTRELESISWILDQEAAIEDMVHQDLCQGCPKATGACGMSAEQVLRAAIVKQMFGFSYELLLVHLPIRTRCSGFAASALPAGVSRNRPLPKTSSAFLLRPGSRSTGS